MQLVSEIMTRQVRAISPQDTIRQAARLMDDLNVGALPVCDEGKLVGMVTDRDITVRGISAGMNPDDSLVDDVMSTDVRWCFEDQPLAEVIRQMADTQIRRVPVLSHDEPQKLVGIVSLGDIATKPAAQEADLDDVIGKISYPSEPDLSPAGVGGEAPETAALSDAPSSIASRTGSTAWLEGSDVEAEQMNPDVEVSSTADPSDVVEVTPQDLLNKNAPDSQTIRRTDFNAGQDQPVVVRRVGSAGQDTSTGETGDPSGIGAGGPAGASGGTGGTSGSPGTGVGAGA